MASFQVDATPVEDVTTEPESTTNAVAPPPPPPETVTCVKVDATPVEDVTTEPESTTNAVAPEDDEDPEDLTAPPYEEKAGNSEDEEERDVEYLSFVEGGDEPPGWYAAGEPAATFNEDDDDF